ncbi:hypothetical protein [Novosphingobium sp.]|uniref:hypothetical protein n=1 Tax=Novosphingobium sp. TaxID=1874826 RepID=UPI003D6CD780
MSGRGIPAGRLSIEIIGEIARLQSDMDKMRRIVRDSSGDIAKNAKVANDNLAGIGRGAGAGLKQFSKDAQRANEYLRDIAKTSADVATRINAVVGVTGGMRRSADDIAAYGKELDRLRGQYNPLFAVIQKYRASVDEIRSAHSVGAISTDEMTKAISRQRQASLESIAAIKGRASAAQQDAQAQREAAQASQAAALAAKEAAQQQAAYAAQAAVVRGQLDPMFAAQQRFNQQMDLLDTLLREGAIRQHEYAAATAQARAALQDQAQAVMRNEAVLEDVGNGFKKSSGNARNFSLQMSQVGQQVMAGTGVIQALAIQLPDMTAGMHGAQEGAGRFAAFMGGPWGIALTTAIGLAATFAMTLLDEGESLDANVEKLRKDAAQTAATATAKAEFEKTLDGVVAAINEQNAALEKSITTSQQAEIQAYNEALQRRNNTVRIREQTVALLEQQKVLAENAKSTNIFAGGPGGAQSIVANQYAAEVERVQRDLETAKAAVAKAERGVRLAEIPRNQRAVAESIDAAAAATGRYERNLQKLNDQRKNGTISQKQYIALERAAQVTRDKAIKAAEEAQKKHRPTSDERRAERLGREADATQALISGLYKSADAYAVSTAAGIRARVEAEATAKGIQKQADVQSYAAAELRNYVADQVNGSAEAVAAMNDQTRAQEFVNKAISSGALDASKASEALADMAEQQKLMTAMSVASMNDDAKGYDKAKAALGRLTEAQLANKKARKETEDAIQSAQISRAIEDIRTETKLTTDLGAARLQALRGLSGAALEDELARIALEQEKIAIQVRAETEARRLRDAGLTKSADLKMQEAEAAKQQADARFEIEKQTVAIERYNDSLRDTIDLLGDLGKVGQGLGALLGIFTGNTTGIRGPLGDLLNTSMTGKNDKGEDIASSIGEEMSKIFKKDGAFVKAVVPVLQSAATGMAAGSALFGKQSAAEQAGSALGGALGGSKVVEGALSKGLESLSKGLGQFAGPLGSVLGGVLGSALGSAFTKVKWGRVDLSAAGVSGTSGNSSSSQKAALAAGNSIYGGLSDLASQLGGSIGNFGNISVGVRHGDYRVNAGGTSLKVKKGAVDFNDDAEAAVAYAMKLAIERGAITGIRASTNNLLKAGDDLSTQLNKALSFEGVFTELKTYLDPVGAELDSLDKEFANLRSIFAEAGATAAEYAQLEQLLSIKRQEAMDKETDALNDIRSRIAEASGDEATVTAIARAKELKDATSDAQRALLQQLYAVEDANAAQEALTATQEAAATAAEQLRQAWESVGDSLLDEVNRIRGLTGGDDAASFATLQGQFNAAVLAARGGDQEAAAKLADLSQSLLDVAGNVATSRQELERIKAQTAASLEGVYDATKGFADGSTSASSASASASSAIDAASTATASTSTSAAGSDLAAEVRSLRAEVAGLRSDNNAGHAQTASNTKAIQRKLEDVTEDGSGRAISVVSAAA